MVLELKVPHGSDWTVTSNFVSYVFSFFYLAIYWNNHHHLFLTVTFAAERFISSVNLRSRAEC